MLNIALRNNYYALMVCILSQKELNSEEALKKMGIKKRLLDTKYGHFKKARIEDLEDMKKLYEDGKNLEYISNKYNCTRYEITEFFKKNGITSKSKGGNNHGLAPINLEIATKMYYEDMKTIREIARFFHASNTRVSQMFKATGVILRKSRRSSKRGLKNE